MHLTSSDQSIRQITKNKLLFSSNLLLLGLLTVPGMRIHQLQLITNGSTICLMDFWNVSKLNLTHDQNWSIQQTCWMLPINLSASSTNSGYAWLVYYQRYGEQKLHQSKKHTITPTVFLIMKLLENCVFCPNISLEDAEQNDLINFINDSDAAELEKNLNIRKILMTQLGMILSKLFRNIGTNFAKRAPVEQF